MPGIRELIAHPNYIVFCRVPVKARTVQILRVKHAAQQMLVKVGPELGPAPAGRPNRQRPVGHHPRAHRVAVAQPELGERPRTG